MQLKLNYLNNLNDKIYLKIYKENFNCVENKIFLQLKIFSNLDFQLRFPIWDSVNKKLIDEKKNF